jgi:uncharacterized protein (DUF849 family)
MINEPTQSNCCASPQTVTPTRQYPVYYKLDGFASSIGDSTPLLLLIREAQHVISDQARELQLAKQTVFEHECQIENLERDVYSVQKQLAELKPESQSDPADEAEEMVNLKNVESHVKALCETIGVSTEYGCFKDWLAYIREHFHKLPNTKGDSGAKEENS